MIRYDARKSRLLIAPASHACTPAPTNVGSRRPPSSSGTKTIGDSPPTQRRSRAGERIAAGRRAEVGTAWARVLLMCYGAAPTVGTATYRRRPTDGDRGTAT